jgi:lipopolysaccharide export system permease protein
MTRLLDRYVLGIFVPALLMFTLTLLVLFIAVDCARNLSKFLELQGGAVLPFVVKYYLYRTPMLLNLLLPSVLLFAPTFTIIKLARANEILPIATCGTSLRRMSLPFIVAAFLAALTMGALEEFVLPRVSDEISEGDAMFSQRGVRYNAEAYDGRHKLWAWRFDFTPPRLSDKVRFTTLDDKLRPVLVVIARRADWDAERRRWVAFDGSIEKPQELRKEPGEKPRTWEEPIPSEGTVVDSPLTPEAIRKDLAAAGRFTAAPLRDLLDELERKPHVPTTVMKVHSRFSFPLSPLVLLLVGLPFVMDPHSKSFIKGLIFCFLLALGFYVTHFVCADLGNKGQLPPVLMAWLPVAAFGLAGIVAFSRMRT